jgi:hypothetical protein
LTVPISRAQLTGGFLARGLSPQRLPEPEFIFGGATSEDRGKPQLEKDLLSDLLSNAEDRDQN